MTTVSFITKETYDCDFKEGLGSLMFPGDYYDCQSYLDKRKLRKQFKEELAGKRLYAVLLHTDNSKQYKNIQNKQIKFKTPLVADETTDGAYKRNFPDNEALSRFWYYDHPVGDVIVVYSVMKPRKAKEAK
jgi:hypothetical protein